MTYAFVLSNMATRKISSDSSEEVLNAAINDLCQGNIAADKCITYQIFKAAGTFQNLAITHASTWAVQDGPPETKSESLNALVE